MKNIKQGGADRPETRGKAPKVLERRVIIDADARSGARALPLAVLFLFFTIVFLAYLYTQGYFDSGIVPTPPSSSRSARKPPEPGIAANAVKVDAVGNKKIEEASRLIKSGDCSGAVPLLNEVFVSDPSRVDVKRALAGCLNTLGSLHYKDGSYAQAEKYFRDAMSYDPDPVVVRNLVNTKIKLKEYAAAAGVLESLPEKERNKALLLDVYYALVVENSNSGDYSRAAEYALKGQAIDAGDDRFKNLPVAQDGLAAAKKESIKPQGAKDKAEQGMTRVDGGHFVVKYEGGENAVTGYVIRILLESAYLKVGADLGVYPSETVEALLYTGESFRDVTGSPSWAGAVYDGRIKIPAGGISEKTDLLERVIIHEYTHSVVKTVSGGRAPVWLNEGLAQIEEGKKSSMYASQLKRAAKHVRIDLRQLEGSFMNLSAEQALSAYILSLSATEHLVDEYGFSAVMAILENLRNGMTMDESMRAATMLSYDEFQKSWLRHIAR